MMKSCKKKTVGRTPPKRQTHAGKINSVMYITRNDCKSQPPVHYELTDHSGCNTGKMNNVCRNDKQKQCLCRQNL